MLIKSLIGSPQKKNIDSQLLLIAHPCFFGHKRPFLKLGKLQQMSCQAKLSDILVRLHNYHVKDMLSYRPDGP
jgi:hypothetical protein